MINETIRYPHFPGRRSETSKLIEVLRRGKPGDKLTDAELATIAGAPVKPMSKGYAWLQSAIKACVREYNVVWERVRKAGVIVCLDPDGLSKTGKRSLREIRNRARWTNRKLAAADISTATPEVQTSLLMSMAQLGAIHNTADPKGLPVAGANHIDIKKLVESMRE